MNFIIDIDDIKLVNDIAIPVLTSVITAWFCAILIERRATHIKFSRKLTELGFKNTGIKAQTKSEKQEMLNNAEKIKVLFISGTNYLKQNRQLLFDAANKGIEVNLLLCDPTSNFLTDIEKMETNYEVNGKEIRKEGDKISDEIKELIKLYKETKVNMRFYSSEYRLPYIISYQKDKTIKSWLTITLPPYKSSTSFVLRGEKKLDQEHMSNDDFNFIDMIEANFDVIWKNCSIDLHELEKKFPLS